MIIFACPRCSVKQQAPDDAGGKKVACAKCGQRLRVPEPVEMHTLAAVPVQQRIATAPGPAAAPAAPKDWYYHQGGKPCGPISWAELKRMAVEGDLSDEDPVWREGMTEWKAAKTLPNLFARPKKVAKDGKEGGGRWWEGMGVFLFCGLAGAALLIFVGYIVTKRGKPAEDKGTPAAQTTKDDKGTPREVADRALEPDEIFKMCSPSVARVKSKAGTGSGFLARPGIVVTNHHVVDGDLAENISVTFPSAPDGNKPLRGILLYEDRKRDLAILRVDTALKPVSLADKEVAPGKRVVVIGSPAGVAGRVVENSVTAGTMSARTQLDDSQDWYQIAVAVNPGNSGGPVFDNHGQVIGVVTLSLRGKQAMNYAVPFGEVAKALDRAVARSATEQEEVVARHDLGVVFHKVGKVACLYHYGMNFKNVAMRVAIEKKENPNVFLKAAAERLARPIGLGARVFLDPSMQDALPRVVGHKSLPESMRQQMEDLILLQKEMKDWYENPRGTIGGYGDKVRDCGTKMTRIFDSLRLKLGINEDPRITLDEKKALDLP